MGQRRSMVGGYRRPSAQSWHTSTVPAIARSAGTARTGAPTDRGRSAP